MDAAMLECVNPANFGPPDPPYSRQGMFLMPPPSRGSLRSSSRVRSSAGNYIDINVATNRLSSIATQTESAKSGTKSTRFQLDNGDGEIDELRLETFESDDDEGRSTLSSSADSPPNPPSNDSGVSELKKPSTTTKKAKQKFPKLLPDSFAKPT